MQEIKKFDNKTEYHYNDKLHRLDGPAIEWSDGTKEYLVNDQQYTELEFNFWFPICKK